MRKGLLILLTFLGFINAVLAQENRLTSFTNTTTDSLISAAQQRQLEDKNNQTYGAKNTRFTFEENFKFNNIIFSNPDTIPDNLHRFSDLERSGYTIQNLGNIGTAYQSLLYRPSEVLGRTSGFHAYDGFYTSPDKIKYYDTRSPYTDVNAAFGGGGRALTNITFTLNDSIHFNLGFNITSIRADEQLAFLTRGDRNVISTDWNIFGFWRPKKAPKYLLLFNVTQFKHEVFEQGGITETLTQPQSAADTLFFDYQDEDVILDEAFSYDKRGGLHIFHQYDVDSIFQVYHSSTYLQQIVRYFDEYSILGSDSLIYTTAADTITSGTISDRSTFNNFENEFGLKGLSKKFSYTLFYRNKLLKYDNVSIAGDVNEVEHYFGGTLRQQITPKIFLSATGEYLVGGNYMLKSVFTSELFDAYFSRIDQKPSFLVGRFLGDQRDWTNTFDDQISDNLEATLKLRTERIDFRPFVRFNRISNYIHYGTDKLPAQANSDVSIFGVGAHFNWKLSEHWYWSNSVHYNTVTGASSETFRVPEIMATSQFAYKNVLFDGKMIIHTGADIHYRSEFFAKAYDPITQQFYLQNDFRNDAFVKVDLFLNFKVKNFLFFVKSAHLNEGITAKGYFISPFFTGTARTLDMGVRWSFYD